MQPGTFSSFVQGPSNRIAFVAALKVATSVEEADKPVLFYGPCGCGKSHLLDAICRQLIERNPDLHVLQAEARTFFDARAHAAQQNTFENRVLLIDNAQFTPRHALAHELLSRAVSEARSVVLCCDRHPDELLLPPELLARFERIEIDRPERQIASAILQRAARHAGFELDPELSRHIAAGLSHDMREVQGTLNRLVTEARIRGENIEQRCAARALPRSHNGRGRNDTKT